MRTEEGFILLQRIKSILPMETVKKMVKFGLTGVMNTAVDFLVFTLLSSLLHVNIYVSQTLSYTAGTLNSYIINKSWTFRSKTKFLSVQFLKFIVVNLIALLSSMGLLYVFTVWCGMGNLLAKVFATVIVMFLNFLMSNFWVFRSKTAKE